jgi:hypothetical protein
MFIKHGELTGNSVKLPKKRKSMVTSSHRHASCIAQSSLLNAAWMYVQCCRAQVFLFNDLVVRAKVVKPNEKYVYEESAGYVSVS